MTKSSLPTYEDLLWPTLKALEATGGSASNEELLEQVATIANLPDELLNIPHKDGPVSEVDYRAAWARTHLKMIGAVDNSVRGVWTLTDIGRQIGSEKETLSRVKEARADRRKTRRQEETAETGDTEDGRALDDSWEESVLTILRRISPAAFERLCQRLLRESGFSKVEVTGRSGDGGIDGAGVLRVRLLSFHVRFQCKRYSGSVGAPEIRDFRGAMVGRADKGLFLTTGRFTKEAEREAIRDGAPAIDLIDGIEVCRLLKSLELGVRIQTIEDVSPIPEFFENL